MGWPSSSMAIAPHSWLIVPSSTRVTSGLATCLAHPAGEHRDRLGDVVGLQPVPAGLVEQHSAAART